MSKATEGKDEMDLDAVAEQELTRLQQHYRIIESNQGNISDKAKLLLNKQRYVINSLLNEKREIMMQLQVASSKRYEEKDNEDNARLSTLMEEKQSENLELTVRDDVVSQSILLHRADRIGAYMNSTSGDRQLTQHESVIGCLSRRREIQMNCLEYIKTEKAQLKELEAQIRKVDKEVTKLKASQETDANVLDKAAAKERNIRLLEGRLHNETVKFNQQVAKNWQLRNEINHLLNDRARFNQIYQALIGKLNHNKKVMMDLVEQATHAYDQREESQNKLALLRERGRLDLVTQSAEMRELKRRFDHDSKLQEFLAVKGQRRLMVDLEQKEATRKRLHREATERQLQHYRETLEKICEFSGETDIDRLSAQFIKQEEENFALFNYVYELNNELEALHDQVVELRSSIDEQTGLSRQREQQQQGRLQALREDLQKATADAEQAEKQFKGWTELRDKLLGGIETLFILIKCDKSPLLELLGRNTHVTPFNMMLFLGLVERRCVDLIGRVAAAERNAKRHNKALPLGGPILDYDKFASAETPPTIEKMVPGQPCPLCVEQEEVSAVGDTLVTPLTRAEIREALITKMGIPGMDIYERVHNISACRLPRSRRIMQKRNIENANQ